MNSLIALCLLLLAGQPEVNDCTVSIPSDRALTTNEFYMALSLAGWPQSYWAEAQEVAMCESRLIPTATNGYAIGLFQTHWSPWLTWCNEDGDLTDPIVSARVAWCIFDRHDNRVWYKSWACAPEYR